MSNQYQSKNGRGGTIITFYYGKNGEQFVEMNVYERQETLTVKEFLDMMIPALSEANRRRALQRKLER